MRSERSLGVPLDSFFRELTAMLGILICLTSFGEVSTVEADPMLDHQKPTVTTSREVDRIARQHRIKLYNTYREERETYDARLAIANEVLKISTQLPPKATEQAELATWFEEASSLLADNSSQPPAIPEIAVDEINRLAEDAISGPAGDRFETSPSAWQAAEIDSSSFEPAQPVEIEEPQEVTVPEPVTETPVTTESPAQDATEPAEQVESKGTEASISSPTGFLLESLGNLLQGEK